MDVILQLLIALFCSPSAQSSLLEAVRNTAALTEVPSNYWAVEVTGGEARARELADKYSLEYLGQVGAENLKLYIVSSCIAIPSPQIGGIDNHYHFRLSQVDSDASERSLHPAFPSPEQSLANKLKLEHNVSC